jgi:hypothetical protein
MAYGVPCVVWESPSSLATPKIRAPADHSRKPIPLDQWTSLLRPARADWHLARVSSSDLGLGRLLSAPRCADMQLRAGRRKATIWQHPGKRATGEPYTPSPGHLAHRWLAVLHKPMQPTAVGTSLSPMAGREDTKSHLSSQNQSLSLAAGR